MRPTRRTRQGQSGRFPALRSTVGWVACPARWPGSGHDGENGRGGGEPAWCRPAQVRGQAAEEARIASRMRRGQVLYGPNGPAPPTHMHGLPSVATRRMAARAAAKDGSALRMDPDAGGPDLPEWRKDLGRRNGFATAYDTRISGERRRGQPGIPGLGGRGNPDTGPSRRGEGARKPGARVPGLSGGRRAGRCDGSTA